MPAARPVHPPDPSVKAASSGGGELVCLHERAVLRRFLAREPLLHLYALGDLQPPFWRRTTWFGWRQGQVLRAVLLIYSGLADPALMALTAPGAQAPMLALLDATADLLPRRFHGHLSLGLVDGLAGRWRITPYGEFFKMGLVHAASLAAVVQGGCEGGEVEVLSVPHLGELRALYDAAYPHNFFESSMLSAGPYLGIRRAGRLVSVAGVHVCSTREGVAALGNVATHPDHRRQGSGLMAVAALCLHLQQRGITTIGLNVRADNQVAVACYEKLGFRVVARYLEVDAR